MTQLGASERLMNLVFEAVGEALGAMRGNATLLPFALMLTKEGIVLQRFTEASVQAALDRAQAVLQAADEDTLAYTLVYDGVITVNNEDQDALVIEAGERGDAHGYRFAQRYQPTPKSPLPPPAVGNLAYMGTTDLLFG